MVQKLFSIAIEDVYPRAPERKTLSYTHLLDQVRM